MAAAFRLLHKFPLFEKDSLILRSTRKMHGSNTGFPWHYHRCREPKADAKITTKKKSIEICGKQNKKNPQEYEDDATERCCRWSVCVSLPPSRSVFYKC
jgi:hypothetical protein